MIGGGLAPITRQLIFTGISADSGRFSPTNFIDNGRTEKLKNKIIPSKAKLKKIQQ